MAKKRNTRAEIAAKLAQADVLVKQGRIQSEIAETLGISVMTYHRWRKAQAHAPRVAATPAPVADIPNVRDRSTRIADLRSENDRLRRLLTDLMLDKMRLEEELTRSPTTSKRLRR